MPCRPCFKLQPEGFYGEKKSIKTPPKKPKASRLTMYFWLRFTVTFFFIIKKVKWFMEVNIPYIIYIHKCQWKVVGEDSIF